MVNSPGLSQVHKALHAAYTAREMARNKLLADEHSAAEEEFAMATNGAHTLESLCEATGLSMDHIQQLMKTAEDSIMHHVVVPHNGGVAHANVVMYGLKEHRNGQPGWKLGIDF